MNLAAVQRNRDSLGMYLTEFEFVHMIGLDYIFLHISLTCLLKQLGMTCVLIGVIEINCIKLDVIEKISFF